MSTLLGLASTVMRATARILVLVLSVTTLGPVLHGSHDEELQSPVGTHDESQHYIQATHDADRAPLDSEHCIACHFVRTSRGPTSREPAGLAAFTPGLRLIHADGRPAATLTASPTPARAPPSHA